MIGGNIGGYVEMTEFENLAEYEKFINRIEQDKGFQTIASAFFNNCLVPVTYSLNMWNSVM
jgi:hypothetical protein